MLIVTVYSRLRGVGVDGMESQLAFIYHDYDITTANITREEQSHYRRLKE